MTLDRFADLDLSVALSTLHEMALREGDLGREYWRRISELLKDAASYRQRALIAEDELRKNRQRIAPLEMRGRGAKISLPQRKRIAEEHPRDIARMQALLIAAGKEYQIDEMILAWHEYSSQIGAVWTVLPKSDEKLLLMLLSAVAP